MKNVTINDLKVGLIDLLDPTKPRFSVLSQTKAWGFYGDGLLKKQKELLALPVDVFGVSRQSTEALTSADSLHDGFGGAVYFCTESYLRAPDSSREIRAAAQEIRDVFISKLAELRDSYSDESTRAKERWEKLEAYKSKLQMFPVAGGKTLYDWTKSYLENGKKLAELMSVRAFTEAQQSDPAKSAAATLRGEILSVLTNLRSLLQQERQQNTSLPANIDALLFGLLDELQQKRQAATAPTLPVLTALPPQKEDD